MTTSEHIKHYFPEEFNKIFELIDKLSLSFGNHEGIIESTQLQINESSFDELQQIILFRLQNIFKQMESLLNSNNNRLYVVKCLIKYFGQIGFKVLYFVSLLH
jgi:hypothetical protein